MATYSRLLLYALVVGGLCVSVGYLRPDWAEALGLDLWNLPALQATMDAEGQRLAALEDGREEVLRRIDLKEQLAGEVIDGRLGLLGAAARFRDLTPATSPARHYLRFVYEGADDDERFCRAVIAWVRRLLKERRPAEAERGVARLEAELEEHVRRDGRVTLPE